MQFKHEKFEPDQKSEQGKITIGDSWSDSNIAPVESVNMNNLFFLPKFDVKREYVTNFIL